MLVKVSVGKHSHVKKPEEYQAIMAKVLRAVGLPLSQEWQLALGPTIRGSGHTPDFRAVAPSDTKPAVTVEIRTGDNSTNLSCLLFVPKKSGLSKKQLYDFLNQYKNGKVVSQQRKEKKVVKKKKPAGKKPVETAPPSPLQGLSDDLDRSSVALLAIADASGLDNFIKTAKARKAIASTVNGEVTDKGLGGIIGAFCRRGWLEEDRTGSGHLRGVRLSEVGRRMAGEEKPEKEAPPPPKEGLSAAEGAIEAELGELDERLVKLASEYEAKCKPVKDRADKLRVALEVLRDL